MTPSSSGTVVDAVRRSVNAQRFLGIATDLVGISSPTRCAAAVADKLAEMLTAFGFDVERHVADWPEAPAVSVRWEAARPGPVLQIDGRLDTVHESVALSELVRVAQVYAVTAIAFCNETS